MVAIKAPRCMNSTTLPFRPNKYVYAFTDAFMSSIEEGEDGRTHIDEKLADCADEMFVTEFLKVREEFDEFVAEFPLNASAYTLMTDAGNASRFMEEGYDLLQALCQVLMMGSVATALSHDTMVTAVTMKCLSRDKNFYQPASADECMAELRDCADC